MKTRSFRATTSAVEQLYERPVVSRVTLARKIDVARPGWKVVDADDSGMRFTAVMVRILPDEDEVISVGRRFVEFDDVTPASLFAQARANTAEALFAAARSAQHTPVKRSAAAVPSAGASSRKKAKLSKRGTGSTWFADDEAADDDGHDESSDDTQAPDSCMTTEDSDELLIDEAGDVRPENNNASFHRAVDNRSAITLDPDSARRRPLAASVRKADSHVATAPQQKPFLASGANVAYNALPRPALQDCSNTAQQRSGISFR